jgi:3-oxoacyl-[acyl-carrier protein] reductase
VLSKKALVTGASAGIGLAIVSRLLDEGWQVIGFDRAGASHAHSNYTHHQIDLTDRAALAQACESLEVGAFVHAAGFIRVGMAGALELSDSDAMWQIHAQAAAQITNALSPKLSAKNFGRIVFIGSRVSQGLAGRGQYAAVKAAIVAMARSWAAELAPRGVTVNVVSPAATQTTMLSAIERAASPPRTPPIGRFIEPREVAALVSFLLSEDAAAITGQELFVCGGASLHV